MLNVIKPYLRRLIWPAALLISLLLAAPGVAAQTPPPPPAPPIPLGFQVEIADAQHLEAARAAGAQFVTVVFNWASIEPEPGYHYWAEPDAALRAAQFYGLSLIARLDQPPAWAVRSGQPLPVDAAAYADFARRVAERYGPRLAGVILWNEPNLSLEWANQPPNAAAYAQLLKPAATAIKAAAPQLPVALAGLAATEGEGDWAVNDLDYLQAVYAAGAAPYFDALAAHPYGFGRPPADAPQKYRPNFRRLELYRRLMVANGDSAKSIWVTEMGWRTGTTDPKTQWQVVSPALQAEYLPGAIAYAQANYPWVARLGLWQLNAAGDPYGFNLWDGPAAISPAYRQLVDTCAARSNRCRLDYAAAPTQSELLAADTAIRLGDRDTLYPHWVHLYHGGSLSWGGEFYLSGADAARPFDMLLETMQVTQPTDTLWLNGHRLGALAPRARPDITSTWVTQKFHIPPNLLNPGPNRLTLTVGPRNPARQYNTARWENTQFRHVRLEPAATLPAPQLGPWQPRLSPGGWAETNRLRPTVTGELWLTGNRPGQLWQVAATPPFTLTNHSSNSPQAVFNDVLTTPAGAQLAATDGGLVWRAAVTAPWQTAAAPAAHAYAVAQSGGRYWAGFEAEGLWSASALAEPWQRATLTAATVLDIVPAPANTVYAVTPDQLWATRRFTGPWVALPLPGLTAAQLDDAGEAWGDKLRPRLWVGNNGALALRNQDRLWVTTITATTPLTANLAWQPFGPPDMYGKLYSVANCCGAGAVVGTNKAGLWQLAQSGAWSRVDAGAFDITDATEVQSIGPTLFAAGEVGLLASTDGGRNWQAAAGLPPVVSSLLANPAAPSQWLAGTPAGVYLSRNAGESWQPISPPWTVWDMAFGPAGRLLVGRSNGLAFTDDVSNGLDWQSANALRKVFFLRIKPNPGHPAQVWSGTWGNNIAASDDGGATVAPIHHGLETLTGLDLIWHATPGQVTLATVEGLYRTDTGGQSWFKLPGPLAQQTVHSLLQTESGLILAGSAAGLWQSPDFGVSWAQVKGVPTAAVVRLGALELPPPDTIPFAPGQGWPLALASPRWLWAGLEGGGLWFSADGGKLWRFGGLANQTVYNILLDLTRYRQLVAATDAGLFATNLAVATQ